MGYDTCLVMKIFTIGLPAECALAIGKSAFMGTLFEQPPQAQIRPKAKYLCVHQIANDKTIILNTENFQKVHSRPKLWGVEKSCGEIG